MPLLLTAAGVILIVVALRQPRGPTRPCVVLALGVAAGIATESAYRLDAFGQADSLAVWGVLLVLLSIGTVIAWRRSLVR